jgi:VanZ family protein
MGAIAKVATFLLGLVGAFSVAWFVTNWLPGFWLPAAFGGCATLLLSHFTVTHRQVVRPFGFAVFFGVLALWAWSSDLEPYTARLRLQEPLRWMLAIGAFAGTTWLLTSARQLQSAQRNRLVGLVALLFLTLLVAFFSGDAGGPDPMLEWLGSLGLSPDATRITTLIFRKGVHFGFYAAVAATGAWAVKGLGADWRGQAQFGLGYAFVLACFDEGRQLSSPERSASWVDICIDMAGAAFALWLMGRAARKKTALETANDF